MTDDTMLADAPEKDTLSQAEDHFDGNESELPDPDEDLEETTSEDDESEGAEESEDTDENEDETDAEEGADQPDIVEVEYEGKKYKVPTELEKALLRQGDYTRKTQEVASERKAIEAEREQVQQMAQVTREEIGAIADLRSLDAQIEQYKNVNWQAAFAEDPFGAQSARAAFEDLKDKRAAALQTYQQASGKRTQQAEQATATRLQKTAEYAKKNIPNWSDDLDAQITKYAESKGFDRDTLRSAYTPQVLEILHKAYIGEQLMTKQAAAKPKPANTGEKKPLTKVKSKGAPAGSKSIAEMSMKEYADYMNKRDKARAARR